MLLSAYENDSWKTASLSWVEEKEDGAVEVIATKADRVKLALEHTLIQPFVGEKFDSEKFIKAFGRIEKNPALMIPERGRTSAFCSRNVDRWCLPKATSTRRS